jgi:hypothetical protein
VVVEEEEEEEEEEEGEEGGDEVRVGKMWMGKEVVEQSTLTHLAPPPTLPRH